MVQYNKIDLHLTNLQLKKIADAVKNNNGTTIRLSNKNFNKNQLIHGLYLTEQQLNKLKKKIENNMSTDIKLSIVQINKIIKEGGNLGRLLMSFLLKLIKPAISVGKNILAPLGFKCSHVSNRCCNVSGNTTSIISNDDLNDLIKIVTILEEHDILLKGISKTIKNNTKNKNEDFFVCY